MENIKSVQGLDIEQGLKRMAGNSSLYKRLLLRFCNDNQDLVCETRKWYEEGEIEKCLRTIHTFKGVSGNLGAVDLCQISMCLEKELKNGDKAEFENSLNKFSEILPETLSQINKELTTWKET